MAVRMSPGSTATTPTPRSPELVGEREREEVERGLAGAVAAPAGIAADGRVARDVDDQAATLLEQRQRLLGKRQRRHDVDREKALERGDRKFGERRQRARAEVGGVVDEEIEAAEIPGRGDQPAAEIGIGDVAGERHDAAAIVRGGAAGGGKLVGAASGEHEVVVLGGEERGKGGAEAAAAAGDQSDAVHGGDSFPGSTARGSGRPP